MRLRVFVVVLLSLVLATAVAPPYARAQAPSDAELEALNDRVIALYQAGKYAGAISLAQQYATATKARHGESSPQYATVLNNLALLLQATNRLAEAEPLMRRAIAIFEQSYDPKGWEHPSIWAPFVLVGNPLN